MSHFTFYFILLLSIWIIQGKLWATSRGGTDFNDCCYSICCSFLIKSSSETLKQAWFLKPGQVFTVDRSGNLSAANAMH